MKNKGDRRAEPGPNSRHVALAAVAHPDDIEFMMAGTLLLLKEAGAEIHMWNLANGSCGTVRHGRDEIVAMRGQETRYSARVAGAVAHTPLFDDLAVFYDKPSLARVAAVMRDIRPSIVLTHSPQDYMEDHQNTCRLIVSAAFARGMPNFPTDPPRPAWDAPVAVYHALPHGLRDGLGQVVRPDACVNVADGVTNSPTYDLDGNMLTSGAWTFTWDGENRLSEISNLESRISFSYDYMGRRFSKTTINRAQSTTNQALYLYDGWAMIRETISNDQSPMTSSTASTSRGACRAPAPSADSWLQPLEGRPPCRPSSTVTTPTGT